MASALCAMRSPANNRADDAAAPDALTAGIDEPLRVRPLRRPIEYHAQAAGHPREDGHFELDALGVGFRSR